MCNVTKSHLIVVFTRVDGCIVVEVASNLSKKSNFHSFSFESENRLRKEVKMDLPSTASNIRVIRRKKEFSHANIQF
jgi:hypothetical protein